MDNRIDRLTDEVLKEMDTKSETDVASFKNRLIEMFNKLPEDEKSEISDKELKKRIKRILAIRRISGLLSDLPEDKKERIRNNAIEI